MPYEWVDHTAELELRVEAPSENEVFAEALRAIAELAGGDESGPDRLTREVSVSAPDRAALLVEWLNELVFLAETEGFVPTTVDRIELGDRALDATVAGPRTPPRPLVKAVTYHGLAFEPGDGGWRATVVIDV